MEAACIIAAAEVKVTLNLLAAELDSAAVGRRFARLFNTALCTA
jgi:hypothetical protein